MITLYFIKTSLWLYLSDSELLWLCRTCKEFAPYIPSITYRDFHEEYHAEYKMEALQLLARSDKIPGSDTKIKKLISYPQLLHNAILPPNLTYLEILGNIGDECNINFPNMLNELVIENIFPIRASQLQNLKKITINNMYATDLYLFRKLPAIEEITISIIKINKFIYTIRPTISKFTIDRAYWLSGFRLKYYKMTAVSCPDNITREVISQHDHPTSS